MLDVKENLARRKGIAERMTISSVPERNEEERPMKRDH
jgi:hypothetical protein